MQRQTLPDRHPDTLTSINYLALLYKAQRQYNKSEALHNEALLARRIVRGKFHPDTLASANNLGCLYALRREFDKAEALYKEVYDSSVYCKMHRKVNLYAKNLAILYQRQGKHDLAKALL